MYFFFNDTATTEIYTLSLHDALPILPNAIKSAAPSTPTMNVRRLIDGLPCADPVPDEARSDTAAGRYRSEEHTSELQSQFHLVCRLLLEKKKKKFITTHIHKPSALAL